MIPFFNFSNWFIRSFILEDAVLSVWKKIVGAIEILHSRRLLELVFIPLNGQILTLIDELKEEFGRSIEAQSWIDDDMKARLVKKVNEKQNKKTKTKIFWNALGRSLSTVKLT